MMSNVKILIHFLITEGFGFFIINTGLSYPEVKLYLIRYISTGKLYNKVNPACQLSDIGMRHRSFIMFMKEIKKQKLSASRRKELQFIRSNIIWYFNPLFVHFLFRL